MRASYNYLPRYEQNSYGNRSYGQSNSGYGNDFSSMFSSIFGGYSSRSCGYGNSNNSMSMIMQLIIKLLTQSSSSSNCRPRPNCYQPPSNCEPEPPPYCPPPPPTTHCVDDDEIVDHNPTTPTNPNIIGDPKFEGINAFTGETISFLFNGDPNHNVAGGGVAVENGVVTADPNFYNVFSIGPNDLQGQIGAMGIGPEHPNYFIKFRGQLGTENLPVVLDAINNKIIVNGQELQDGQSVSFNSGAVKLDANGNPTSIPGSITRNGTNAVIDMGGYTLNVTRKVGGGNDYFYDVGASSDAEAHAYLSKNENGLTNVDQNGNKLSELPGGILGSAFFSPDTDAIKAIINKPWEENQREIADKFKVGTDENNLDWSNKFFGNNRYIVFENQATTGTNAAATGA